MEVLQTQNLTKKFGSVTALNNVSIQMNEGEVYGFIGPNGAGKSTTIRILLGMLRATDGNAKIFGKDVWKDAVNIHKRIAYVPGDVNLWPNLTGGEVIDLFLKLRGASGAGRQEELIQRFNLDPTKKCGTYSKGNRQKIALIAAFSSDADLFILDEPTSGLDPLMERIFQEYIVEARDRGKSVLLSSHILSEVEKLCDRIGIIRQGEIIETGSLKELRHLTRTNLLIETKKAIPSLGSIKGIHALKRNGQSVSFQVDMEELDEVLLYVSRYGITKLESAPPTLEDLFMRHYDNTGEPVRVGGGF
ncbi:ABC transporter ATP-binding protein [Planococcus lenghuensis]|uniref:ABC transporter ATP-binding protein n=1 Tax=Planococcus lenghuensis TaxID=2213202 RepID=A0A1Q2KUP6_9BACL|nr:ABC transporter ATP-binding protein [Planococcus lenghuensis]AQQ51844.1 ABC transporter ATP-binding protein [Planococcus lenghuensis]